MNSLETIKDKVLKFLKFLAVNTGKGFCFVGNKLKSVDDPEPPPVSNIVDDPEPPPRTDDN